MADILTVRNLTTVFKRPDGIVRAVEGVSYTLAEGESLGIVGESGSGKSVSVLSLLRLLKGNGTIESGEAIFNGRDLLKLGKEELRKVRGHEVAMIFQDPMTSLNPSYRISRQMMEPALWHQIFRKSAPAAPSTKPFFKRLWDKFTVEMKLRADEGKSAADNGIKTLDHVGIPEARRRFADYPFQFSGGMRQRVMIAMSLTCRPKLLIADEPTTALDVTVRSQILNLLQDMKKEFGMAVIMITHDFGIATNFCDRIIVMYAGRIVETAKTSVFVTAPKHPYSKGLLGSTLEIDSSDKPLTPIPGNPPNMLAPPPGCAFHPRCTSAIERCRTEVPPLLEVAPGHCAACHLVPGGNSCG
jgi:oligopeptide/dipeptide ABC transporter ATP-binding protein